MLTAEVRLHAILEKFPDLLQHAGGPSDRVIRGLAAPNAANESHLVFIPDAKHLELAAKGNSQVWVIHRQLFGKLTPDDDRTVVTSENVQLAMALVGRTFFPITHNQQIVPGAAIHPSACVAEDVKLGRDVIIGPGAVVGSGCEIADRVFIGANAVIEPFVKIGANSKIHPLVFIGHSCEIGANCEIHPNSTIGTEGYGYAHDRQGNHYRITHYGRVILEDDVHIGAGVQIDRGTFEDSRIGYGTKIDNHCHFGHNIRIGKNTLITGGMITAGSVTIGSHCVFGGRTTVSGHLEIASQSQFAGLSGISKSVETPGQYGGYPLQSLKNALKTSASLPTVPELRKQVARLLKAVGLEKKE